MNDAVERLNGLCKRVGLHDGYVTVYRERTSNVGRLHYWLFGVRNLPVSLGTHEYGARVRIERLGKEVNR